MDCRNSITFSVKCPPPETEGAFHQPGLLGRGQALGMSQQGCFPCRTLTECENGSRRKGHIKCTQLICHRDLIGAVTPGSLLAEGAIQLAGRQGAFLPLQTQETQTQENQASVLPTRLLSHQPYLSIPISASNSAPAPSF